MIAGQRRLASFALALSMVSLLCVEDARPAQISLPNGGTPVGAGREPIGCRSQVGRVVSRGAAAGREVALTFDDGPSFAQTPAILAILVRLHAKATFFEEGRHVHGREALMNQILASGDEIGNHSYHHPEYPGYGELVATDRRIHAATGFEPCLFRPPYGLIDAKVSSAEIGRAHV